MAFFVCSAILEDNFFFYHCGFGKAFGQFDVAGCLPTLFWEEAAPA